jgi:hypothetical protein
LIVNGTVGDSAEHLVPCGDLLLDRYELIGKRGIQLGHRALESLAIRLLAAHQTALEEVGGYHLVHGIQVTPSRCLQEAADDDLVLLSLRGHSSFLLSRPTCVLLQNGLPTTTTSMMPPGGVWRIALRLIHPSAWKEKF